MNSISLAGIAIEKDNIDDRTKIFLTVNVDEELFDWQIRMPPTFSGTFDEFIQSQQEIIFAEVESKIQQWQQLDPKTREYADIDGETYTVDIQKKDIVQPTYPDYYVLRAKEYPNLSEQLDAFWKGEESLQVMKDKITYIKQKYPKPVF